MVLTSAAAIAFVPATDLARARAFYENVLGLSLLEDNGFACVFDVNGTMLRVTAVSELQPAEYTVLGWEVDDIGATLRALVGAGVAVRRIDGMEQDTDGVWTAPGGDRVAWFADPDGNTLSLTQFVTSAPSTTPSATRSTPSETTPSSPAAKPPPCAGSVTNTAGGSTTAGAPAPPTSTARSRPSASPA